MSKSYRSLLWTGAVLALVAGCGDDVTISPAITVSVGPDGVSIPIGGTVQMSAAVNAPSGVSTTVTWTSSNQGVASVSATGLVTGVTAGSVAIQACSTENTSACGQATVTVAAPVPATISIQSVTTGATNTPVNINNVFGQIDVSLNFEPGSTPATSVELLIDGAVVASQGFSALEWGALVAKAVEEGGELAKVVIVLSVNTADFNATTGVPKFLNGPRQLSARANLQGGSQVATPSTTLVFANQSGFVTSVTNANNNSVPGVTLPSSAINPNTGQSWIAGNVTLNIVGVNYASSGTFTGLSGSFMGRVFANVAPTTGSTWSIVFPNSGATSLNIVGYQSAPAGDSPVITSSTLTGGINGSTTIINGTLPSLPAVTLVRVDNLAPAAPVMGSNPIWVNAAFTFNATNTLTTVGSDGTGVDAVTAAFYTGATLPSSACSVTGLTLTTTASPTLAETTVSTAYSGRVLTYDLLGNLACANLVNTFGADYVAPTGTLAGPADQSAANATGATWSFTVADNASGFGATPVFGTIRRVNPTNTTCVLGTGTACNPTTAALAFDAYNGVTVDGYYTFDPINVRDQALNSLSFTGRTYLLDQVPAAFAGGMSLQALYVGNAAATFTSAATDNIDIATVQGTLTYPTAPTMEFPAQDVGAYGSAAFTTSTNVTFTINNFMRCLNAAGDFATTTNKPSSVDLLVSDFAQAAPTSFGGFPIPGGNVQDCGAVGATTINSFTDVAPSYGAGKTQVDISGTSLAAASSSTVVVSAVADVPLNTSVDPFARVEFWYINGAGNLVRIGQTTGQLSQTPANRTYTYSFTWDPDSAVQAGNVTVIAIGVDAQGDAVQTAGAVVVTVP